MKSVDFLFWILIGTLLIAVSVLRLGDLSAVQIEWLCKGLAVLLAFRTFVVAYPILKSIPKDAIQKDTIGFGVFAAMKRQHGWSGVMSVYGNLMIAFSLYMSPLLFSLNTSPQ